MKGDSELAKAWNLTQNKASLIAKARDAFGDALFTLLKTTLVEEHEHKSEISFTGTGNWTDEKDLRIRYKDRPERLDAILKHARRYICPTTGTEFIEEMTYNSVSTASETHKSREKREFEGTEKLKQPKKLKVSNAEGKDNLSNASEKPLTAWQSKQLDKYMDDLKKIFDDVSASHEKIKKSKDEHGWAENLPPYTQPQLQALLAKKLEFDSKVTLIKDSVGVDWKLVREEVGSLKSEAKDLMTKAAFQIDEAILLASPQTKEKAKNKPKSKPPKRAACADVD